jgi:hypothetical protein
MGYSRVTVEESELQQGTVRHSWGVVDYSRMTVVQPEDWCTTWKLMHSRKAGVQPGAVIQ